MGWCIAESIDALAPLNGVFLDASELRSRAGSELQTYRTVAFADFTHMWSGFRSARREEALDRLRDMRVFFRSSAITRQRVAILAQHKVHQVIVEISKRGRFDFAALGPEHVVDIDDEMVLFLRSEPAG